MIGVIGCGNMSSAIVRGMHKVYPNEKFVTYTPSFVRAEKLAQEVEGVAVKTLAELKGVETLIIGCKPQQFEELAQNLKDIKLENPHVISIMAAVSIETIRKKLGYQSVTRFMPNTPSLFNEGMGLLIHADEVSEAQRSHILKLLSSVSKLQMLESEELFDRVTTVTGSGPAYIFYFAKNLCDELEKWGIDSVDAKKMVIQLFKGSTAMMENSKELTLSELVDQVTSKGGVTIEAIHKFKELNMDQMIAAALKAAYHRSIEITKSFT